MRILGGTLCADDGTAVRVESCPNKGGRFDGPLGIVIHYTAGRGFEESIRWLCNPKAKAGAHLVIGGAGAHLGKIAQLVSFSERAWHAGKSEWNGRPGCNDYTIGIELDNPGKLVRHASGWRTYFGAVVSMDDVVIAPDGTGWRAYPEEQVLACYAACEALIDAYPDIAHPDVGVGILGHSDIAPGRKVDPGPAFPMASFRGWLLGRGDG